MTEEWDSDNQRRQFAEARSHQDAKISNDNARAAGQAAILINGGAATAILAYLAKENSSGPLVHVASLCLGGYALGVLLGALYMLCIVFGVDWWNSYWESKALHYGKKSESVSLQNATWWDKAATYFFSASMACFISSSFAVAATVFVGK
jgi:ABC-type Fe3+-siderophore transport system permease subunit